ncbi:nitrate/nitrite transporter [Idiomarina piscisalsi]|uniref:MFS transporter n=1 Tax=Idiomarina piscisalsi TaxID=1096243 RepID=UPI00137C6B22|nr:MFS transporter [Idiomarina piscisalsi]MTJ01628.1 NarK/NasA family nitrate transporter [Idiomarina piscisalsi]
MLETAYSANALRALIVATLVFAINFAVWTLYAGLTEVLVADLNLSLLELSGLLAAPILTGALCRIPSGWLVQYFKPKVLMTSQMILVLPALIFLPHIDSYWGFFAVGLWFGLAGCSFTFGITYVSQFYPSGSQGLVMGLFGVGNAGAALSLVLAPELQHQWSLVSWVYSGVLLLGLFLWVMLAPAGNDYPKKGQTSILPYLKQLRVWRMGLYYYFVFGSFLALLVWLPHYYMQAYGLTVRQATAYTLVFLVSSSVIRALGGWFADRYGARSVNWGVFWVSIMSLFFLSYPPTTFIIHGIEADVTMLVEINVGLFTFLLTVMGLAQGFGRASVYKLINNYYPDAIGPVGGLVGAFGALGGCTLPILFGFFTEAFGFYSVSFMLLYGVAAFCMIAMYFSVRSEKLNDYLREQSTNNFIESEEQYRP